MGPWPKPEILQVAPRLVTPEPRDNQFWLMANATCTSFILQWPPKSTDGMHGWHELQAQQVTSPEVVELEDALGLPVD